MTIIWNEMLAMNNYLKWNVCHEQLSETKCSPWKLASLDSTTKIVERLEIIPTSLVNGWIFMGKVWVISWSYVRDSMSYFSVSPSVSPSHVYYRRIMHLCHCTEPHTTVGLYFFVSYSNEISSRMCCVVISFCSGLVNNKHMCTFQWRRQDRLLLLYAINKVNMTSSWRGSIAFLVILALSLRWIKILRPCSSFIFNRLVLNIYRT